MAVVERTPSTSSHRDEVLQSTSAAIAQNPTVELRDKHAVPLVTVCEPSSSDSNTPDEGEPEELSPFERASPDGSKAAGCYGATTDNEHSSRPQPPCQNESELPIRNSNDNRPRKLDIREIKNSWLRRKNISAKSTVQLGASRTNQVDRSGRQLQKVSHESPAEQSTPRQPDKRQRKSLAEQHAAWISTECLRVGPSTLPRQKDVPDLIDNERILAIEHCWNRRNWDRAELYLLEHLRAMRRLHDEDRIRRVKHLLAICSSFRGEWDDAIERFVTVSMLFCTRHDSERTGQTEPAVSKMAALSQRRGSECLSFQTWLTIIPIAFRCSGSQFGGSATLTMVIAPPRTGLETFMPCKIADLMPR